MASRRDPPRTKAEGTVRTESAPTVYPDAGAATRRPVAPPRRNDVSRGETRTPPRTEASATRGAATRVEISNEARYRMICEAAYLRAERRGFEPGREVEDWLAAEQEVERLLTAEHVPSAQ